MKRRVCCSAERFEKGRGIQFEKRCCRKCDAAAPE